MIQMIEFSSNCFRFDVIAVRYDESFESVTDPRRGVLDLYNKLINHNEQVDGSQFCGHISLSVLKVSQYLWQCLSLFIIQFPLYLNT